MPWSNKRRANLPRLHPIGLQSCYSTPPGSLPLRQHRIPAPQAAPCTRSASDPHTNRIPATQAAGPSSSDRSMYCPDPHPIGSPPLRLCWAPAPHRTRSHTLPGSPPLGPCRKSALPVFLPLKARHQLSVRQPHTPVFQDPYPSGPARLHIYKLAR
jgi:hypothetical protein